MKCQAKIQDGLGGKYRCDKDAVYNITTETFASHLQSVVKKSRNLCALHAHRLKSKFNYKIKHCNKKCIITEKVI